MYWYRKAVCIMKMTANTIQQLNTEMTPVSIERKERKAKEEKKMKI